MELKRSIFYLYDNIRILFNNYYNNHNNDFSNDELWKIKDEIDKIRKLIKNTDNALYDEFFKDGVPF